MLNKSIKNLRRGISNFISIYLAFYISFSPMLAFIGSPVFAQELVDNAAPIVLDEAVSSDSQVEEVVKPVETPTPDVVVEKPIEKEVPIEKDKPAVKNDVISDDNVELFVLSTVNGELKVDKSVCTPQSVKPCVTTDKHDYAPDELVTVNGYGYEKEAKYQIEISSTDKPAVTHLGNITSDNKGEFEYKYQLDGNYRPNYYILIKNIVDEVVAEHTFTDSRSFDYIKVNGGSSVTLLPNTSFEVEVRVDTDGNGEEDDWDSTKYEIEGQTGVCDDTPNISNDSNNTVSKYNLNSPSNDGTYDLKVTAYSNDGCSSGSKDSSTLKNAIIVQSPKSDLVVTKTNDTSDEVKLGDTFKWTLVVENKGLVNAEFNNEDILQDNLPSDASYLIHSVTKSAGVTGDIDCDIVGDDDLDCDDNSGGSKVVIPPSESFTVKLTVTPNKVVNLVNPRSGGSNKCKVDPDNEVSETNEDNNYCSNTVKVIENTVNNPTLPQACGIDIALIVDNSTSIDSGELNQIKGAMTSFTSAFDGTPTQFSVTRFATTASILSGFSSNITAINSAINSIPVGGGYTNWEDGFVKGFSTLPNRVNPDLVIFASDGNPNRVDNGTDVDEGQAVAQAVIIANSIKTSGSRILALGIGNQLDLDNLKAISGNSVNVGINSDVITSDFATLATDLANYAIALCGGTINIQKFVDQNPASNWTFTVDSQDYVTGNDGYTQSIPVDAGTYSVMETPQNGYGFSSASCSINNQSVGNQVVNGVEGVVVGDNDIVTCTFNNTTNPICGDSVINQENEQCDAGASNGIACTPDYGNSCNYCSSNCQSVEVTGPYCGDGIKNGQEECDGTDGISSSAFACTKKCTIELVESKVNICHSSSSHTNPYIQNSPNKNADVEGHDGHSGPVWYYGIQESWGDIIPSFEYIGGSYPGKNWTIEGQAIYNNKCEIPKGKLVVNKTTVPSLDTKEFEIEVSGDGQIDGEPKAVVTDNQDYTYAMTPGTYTVSEKQYEGWTETNNTCENVSVLAGETKYCEITNVKTTDIAISKVDSPDPLTSGGLLTYLVHVNNQSIVDAQNVVVIDELPTAIFSLFSVIPEQGSCSDTTLPSPIKCELGTVSAGETVTIEIKALVLGLGSISNYAEVSTTTYEVDLSDNQTKEQTNVNELGSACIQGKRWASNIVDVNQGNRKNGTDVLLTRSIPSSILGLPNAIVNPDSGFYSLGFGGSIVLGFSSPVVDGLGTDITIHEVTSGRTSYPEEKAKVEVSTDNGTTWHLVGTVSSKAINGAGELDIAPYNNVTHIKITDTTVSNPHTSDADGYDIDAIEVDCKSTVTVTKNVDEDGDGQVDVINSDKWKWNINGNGNYVTGTSVEVLAGNYTLSEVNQPNYKVTGLICNDKEKDVSESINIDLKNEDSINCTFTNTKEVGNIKVNKFVDLNGDGDWNDNLEKNNTKANELGFRWVFNTQNHQFGSTQSQIVVGNYELNELEVNDYTFVSWFNTNENGKSCTNPNGTKLPVNVSIERNQTTEITICNARDTGSITVIKNSVNDSNQDFWFRSNIAGMTNFKLEDDGNNNDGQKDNITKKAVTGSYYVTESSERGWQLTDITCNDESGYKVDLEKGKVEFLLDKDENLVCTFTNTQLGKIEGFKFEDRDGDSNWDITESKLNNWKIFIDENDNEVHDTGEMFKMTSGTYFIPVYPFFFKSGYYEFENLLPGTYTVCEEQVEGWYNSTPICQTTTITPGDTDRINFGNHTELKINVSKIVCDTEDLLPNWGNGGPNITSNSATNFVNNNNGCRLESGWDFQWGYDGEVSAASGDFLGLASTPWNLLGTTDVNGVAEISITQSKDGKGLGNLWVRESLKDGYVSFSDNEGNYSAEIYCHSDVLNYDNFDRIDNVKFGEAYYCVAFNALKTGDIKVTKDVVDPDGNPVTDITTNFDIQLDGSNTKQITDEQSVVYENLPVGTYTISELTNDKYDLVGYDKDEDLNTSGAQVVVTEEGVTEVLVTNRQKKVTITFEKEVFDNDGTAATSDTQFEIKFNKDGNPVEESPQYIADTANGKVNAVWNVNPGTYSFKEVSSTGFIHTGCVQKLDIVEDINIVQPRSNSGIVEQETQVQLLSGVNETYLCYNYVIPPALQLSKVNSSITDEKAGNIVTYTLTVTAPTLSEQETELTSLEIEDDNKYVVKDVNVTDLTPEGFEYINGTWTATSTHRGDLKASLVTTEPTYASPGTWEIGDMLEGEVVTLTYQTQISTQQDSGLYKDLAWVQGKTVTQQTIFGDPQGESNFGVFAGTDVNVVEEIEEGKAEVLGVTLPATGSNLLLIIIGLIFSTFGLLGLGYLFLKKNGKKLLSAVLVLTFVLLSFEAVNNIAYAQLPPHAIRLEAPRSPSGNINMKIGFVTLDVGMRDMVVKCLVKRPSQVDFVEFATYNITSGGNSGDCLTGPLVFGVDGIYEFKATADIAGDLQSSDSVSVDFDSIGPDKVNNYSNTKGVCNYQLSFRVANDSQSTKVQIFRSTQKSFVANSSTLIKEINVTPNQNISYTDNVPNCSVDYYYAVRALDNADNSSDFVADTLVTITLPVDENTINGQDTGGEVEGENTTNGDGKVDDGDDSTVKPDVEGTETTNDTEGDNQIAEVLKNNSTVAWIAGGTLGGLLLWSLYKNGFLAAIFQKIISIFGKK